jgi:transcriptional antiterminator RfaH
MNKYWTVAQTESQREHIAALHLIRNGFEVYCPRIKNRKKQVEPLFPTYLFVRIELRWHVINATIGILRVLTSCDHPARVSDEVIEEIRGRENSAGFVRLPKPTPGKRVRIVRGMFADHVGIYEGSSGKDRERVLLALLGQMVTVNVRPADLQFAS